MKVDEGIRKEAIWRQWSSIIGELMEDWLECRCSLMELRSPRCNTQPKAAYTRDIETRYRASLGIMRLSVEIKMAFQAPSLLDVHHVLITGGCGFLGSWILRQLLESYPDLKATVLDIHKPASWTSPSPNVSFIQADVTDGLQVVSCFESAKPTAVIHTAGYVTVGSARHNPNKEIRTRTYNINVNGTKNVLEAAKAVGAGTFVYTSSCTVVMDDKTRNHPNENEGAQTGHATLIYGQSKVVPTLRAHRTTR